MGKGYRVRSELPRRYDRRQVLTQRVCVVETRRDDSWTGHRTHFNCAEHKLSTQTSLVYSHNSKQVTVSSTLTVDCT
jgi:hypothetical protein